MSKDQFIPEKYFSIKNYGGAQNNPNILQSQILINKLQFLYDDLLIIHPININSTTVYMLAITNFSYLPQCFNVEILTFKRMTSDIAKNG